MLREGFYSDNFKIDSTGSYSFTGGGSESHNSVSDTINIITGNGVERQMTYTNSSLPNSGYLRVNFKLIRNYPSDFFVYIRAQQDNSNYYEFRVEGDNIASQYIRKYVGGVETDATSTTTGSITGTPIAPPVGGFPCNIDVVLECFWHYNYMRLISAIDNIETEDVELDIVLDATELSISSLYFPWNQGDVKIESLQVKYFAPKIDKEGNIMCFCFSEVELPFSDNPSVYSPEMRLSRDRWLISGEFKEQS